MSDDQLNLPRKLFGVPQSTVELLLEERDRMLDLAERRVKAAEGRAAQLESELHLRDDALAAATAQQAAAGGAGPGPGGGRHGRGWLGDEPVRGSHDAARRAPRGGERAAAGGGERARRGG